MAGAPAQWTKNVWHIASPSTAEIAVPYNKRLSLTTTTSTFRPPLTSCGVRVPIPAADVSRAASLVCITANSAAAIRERNAFCGGGGSQPFTCVPLRFSLKHLGHHTTCSRFVSYSNRHKSQISSSSKNICIVRSVHNCSASNINDSSRNNTVVTYKTSACSRNTGRRSSSEVRICRKSGQWAISLTASSSSRSSSSCTGGAGCRNKLLLRERQRGVNGYSNNINISRDVRGCRCDSKSSIRFDKETNSFSSSRLPNCDADTSSGYKRGILRLGKSTRAVLRDDEHFFRDFPPVSRYYSTSLFSALVIKICRPVSSRHFCGAPLQRTASAYSSRLLLQSPNWAATAPRPKCCSYSHSDGSTTVELSPSHARSFLRVRVNVHGNDGEHSSSEGENSTAWAKAAVAVTAAAAAAAAVAGGNDSQDARDYRGASGIIPRTWYTNLLSCASPLLSLSPPSAGYLNPVSYLSHRASPVSSLSPSASVSRASLFHLQNTNGSDSSSLAVSSSSCAVRGVLSLGRTALARCCGIVGYIGDKEAQPLLLGGLEILQNRGYDSCGISSVPADGGALVTTKYASRGSTCDSLEILKKEAQNPHAGNRVGIGHTRWATHGSKTDANAHPHHDWRDRISVVHNGTIDNFSSLKQALLRRGCKFRSETDTEVIANLIGWHLDNGAGFEEAVKNAVGEIQGTWGLCILHKDYPDRLVLARNGSPLLVGASSGQVFVASEPAALAQHTNQYLMLKDGEIAVITAEGIGQLEATRSMHFIGKEDKIELSPSPFPHWTVKEIYEQPQALARAMNYGGRIAPYRSAVKLGGLDQSRESLLAIKNLLICGCGTSLYAGIYGELLMQWIGCLHQVRAVDASELELHAFPKEDAGILLLSQSGETLDTVRACQLAEIYGIKKFSIVNQVGSLLARLTDCGVYVNAGREVGVASTKAFSCQVTVLSLIAAWFFQNKSERPASQQHSDRCAALMDAIQRLPVYAGMTLNCRDACASVAAKLAAAKTIFVLGKGFGFPVALEGALKIKEVGCIHAEGFAAGALKHGPFALIDEAEHTPVIMLVLGDHHAAYMLNAAQQVKARGAHLVCVTDVPEAVKGVADDVLVVPSNGPLTALLACIPLQLLAYEIAILKGINPDKPRGLAKTVTVF